MSKMYREAILDSNNQVIATITHDKSIDTPLSITNKNGTFYYHRDHQGSIIALTDQTGAVVESFTYDNHYGIITNHTKTIETNNPYGYTARVVDTSELYYYRARYYDPELQRFISQDPIGFASGDFNWYRYVGSDPVNFVDPSGLSDLYIGTVEGLDKWMLDNLPFNNSDFFIEVAGHGNDEPDQWNFGGYYFENGKPDTFKKFNEHVIKPIMELQKFKDNPDMPINLQSCNLANTPIPQYIADKTGRKVYAVYGYYFPGAGGALYGGAKVFYPNNNCNKDCK